MFNRKDLTTLIIEARYSNGTTVPKQWMVNKVTSQLSHDGETDSDVYCRYCTVSRDVEAYFRSEMKKDIDENGEVQMKLEGHERVQQNYPISRDDEVAFVPVDEITDDEIMGQLIPRYERQIVGCQLHIEELLRYMEERREAKTA